MEEKLFCITPKSKPEFEFKIGSGKIQFWINKELRLELETETEWLIQPFIENQDKTIMFWNWLKTERFSVGDNIDIGPQSAKVTIDNRAKEFSDLYGHMEVGEEALLKLQSKKSKQRGKQTCLYIKRLG